jgi:hypothetical protein
MVDAVGADGERRPVVRTAVDLPPSSVARMALGAREPSKRETE